MRGLESGVDEIGFKEMIASWTVRDAIERNQLGRRLAPVVLQNNNQGRCRE